MRGVLNIDLENLIILALAADYFLVIWFNGSLTATLRATAEAWLAHPNAIKRKLGYAMTCPICMPFHATWILFLMALLPYGSVFLYLIAAAGLTQRMYNNVFKRDDTSARTV